MAQQTIGIGAAPNDGTGDPIRDAFDKCNDNFTELYGSLAGLLDFAGATDCSTNPNYPAASQGDIYIVSVAGKIGGASGKVVEVGDFYLALADNAGGDEATVGTSWAVLQANITGGIGSGVDVEDEGVAEATGATTLNFTGAGVTAADVGGGQVDITIPGSSGGIDIEDEGVAEATAATVLNFTGAGVTATDVGGGQVDIDIPGGGGGAVEVVGSTTTIASGGLELTGLSLSNYAKIEIIFEGLTGSATIRPLLTLSVASTFIGGTNYWYNMRDYASSGSTDTEASAGTSSFALLDATSGNWQTATGHSCDGRMEIYSPGNTSFHKQAYWNTHSGQGDSGANAWVSGGGKFTDAGAIDGVRVAGSITSGRMTILGYKRS